MKITAKYFIGILVTGLIVSGISIYLGLQRDFSILALIFALIPVVVYMIVSLIKNRYSLDVLNPLLLYGAFYFIFFGLGGYLTEDNFYKEYGNLGTMLGVLGYVSGYFFSYIFIRKSEKGNTDLKGNNGIGSQLLSSVKFEKVIFYLGLLGYILYIMKIGQIPALMGDLEQARVTASISGGASFRILCYLLIVSAMIGFLNILYTKKYKKVLLITSLLRYFTSIILLLSLANRSPVFNILFTSFLIFIMYKFKGKIKFIKLIIISLIAAVVVIGFVGGIGSYRVINTSTFYNFPEFQQYIRDKDYIGLSIYTFTHYLSIGFENLLRVLSIVPNNLSYQFGSTYIEPILTILPGTQYTIDMQIKMALGQSYLGGGTVPSVLGEAFVNFGVVGWFFVPCITMIVLRLTYYSYLKKSKKSLFSILIYAYLLNYLCYGLLAGYASSSIFPFIAIGLFLVYGYMINLVNSNKDGKKDEISKSDIYYTT